MIKLIGAGLLLCGSGGLAVAAVRYLQSRVDCLRTLGGAVGLMEKELAFRLTPLPELLLILSERTQEPVSDFFGDCRRRLLCGCGEVSVAQLWSEALEQCRIPLLKEERHTLELLGSALGRYDADSQKTALRQVHGELELFLRRAEAEKQKMSRVYSALCLTAGTLMVIILF